MEREEVRRTRLTRVCMLSAHDKCLGGYENSARGWTPCDCTCHETNPTLFTDYEEPAR